MSLSSIDSKFKVVLDGADSKRRRFQGDSES